jgi:outer membrane biosynthesis protein TonB
MADLNLKMSFLVSMGFHALGAYLFVFHPYTNYSKWEIPMEKGISIEISSSNSSNSPKDDLGDAFQSNSSSRTNLGTNPKEAVQVFQNSLRYPNLALEMGLESSCEWLIQVGNDGKAEIIQTIKACQHPIFQVEFQKSLEKWNFPFPPKTIMRIPVRFHINEY